MPEWLVLDTDVTRHTAQGRQELGIDLAALGRAPRRPPISISEVAYLELLDDLAKGQISLLDWRAFVEQIDPLLDPDFPIMPNGRGLGAMLGLVKIDFDLRQSQRSAWHLLRTVRTAEDLRDGRVSEFEGTRRTLRLPEVSRLHSEIETSWAGRFTRVEDGLGRPVTKHDRRDLQEQMHAILGTDLRLLPELELVVAATVERLIQHGRGYRPKLNDALDFEHLFMVGLPAVVCTSDGPFRNFASGLRVVGSDRIKSPAEVLKLLDG